MEAFFPYLDLSGFGGKFSRFITMFKVLQTHHYLKYKTSLIISKKEWATYLDNNGPPGISPCVLWEAGKANIISYCSHKTKEGKRLVLELNKKFDH